MPRRFQPETDPNRVHAFCDASLKDGKAVGAIVYDGKLVIVRLPFVKTSRAEWETIAVACRFADVIHHDQKYLSAAMKRAARGAAAKLRWLVRTTGVQLVCDAWAWEQYHEAHEAARRAVTEGRNA